MIVGKIEMLLLLYPWDLFHLELYLFVRTNLQNKRWIRVMASYFINQVKPEEVNSINILQAAFTCTDPKSPKKILTT